jgi:hypothetical protein
MKWRERWYTRALVWMLIGTPFALAAAVLEERLRVVERGVWPWLRVGCCDRNGRRSLWHTCSGAGASWRSPP